MQTLAEGLLLLALDDDWGTVSWQRSSEFPHGLGGALLMDLALAWRIVSVDKKIVPTGPSPASDDILDDVLETIREAKKPHDAKHWVQKRGDQMGLQERLARRLVARSIFRWVFDSSRYPASDLGREIEVRGRLRDVALAGVEPDTRTLLRLSLVNATRLTDSIFARDERKQAKRRVKDLVEGEQFGKAVGGAISEAVVVTAAIIASTVAATSSSR